MHEEFPHSIQSSVQKDNDPLEIRRSKRFKDVDRERKFYKDDRDPSENKSSIKSTISVLHEKLICNTLTQVLSLLVNKTKNIWNENEAVESIIDMTIQCCRKNVSRLHTSDQPFSVQRSIKSITDEQRNRVKNVYLEYYPKQADWMRKNYRPCYRELAKSTRFQSKIVKLCSQTGNVFDRVINVIRCCLKYHKSDSREKKKIEKHMGAPGSVLPTENDVDILTQVLSLLVNKTKNIWNENEAVECIIDMTIQCCRKAISKFSTINQPSFVRHITTITDEQRNRVKNVYLDHYPTQADWLRLNYRPSVSEVSKFRRNIVKICSQRETVFVRVIDVISYCLEYYKPDSREKNKIQKGIGAYRSFSSTGNSCSSHHPASDSHVEFSAASKNNSQKPDRLSPSENEGESVTDNGSLVKPNALSQSEMNIWNTLRQVLSLLTKKDKNVWNKEAMAVNGHIDSIIQRCKNTIYKLSTVIYSNFATKIKIITDDHRNRVRKIYYDYYPLQSDWLNVEQNECPTIINLSKSTEFKSDIIKLCSQPKELFERILDVIRCCLQNYKPDNRSLLSSTITTVNEADRGAKRIQTASIIDKDHGSTDISILKNCFIRVYGQELSVSNVVNLLRQELVSLRGSGQVCTAFVSQNEDIISAMSQLRKDKKICEADWKNFLADIVRDMQGVITFNKLQNIFEKIDEYTIMMREVKTQSLVMKPYYKRLNDVIMSASEDISTTIHCEKLPTRILWNDDIASAFSDLISCKYRCYNAYWSNPAEKPTFDKKFVDFLAAKHQLWPKGMMTLDFLKCKASEILKSLKLGLAENEVGVPVLAYTENILTKKELNKLKNYRDYDKPQHPAKDDIFKDTRYSQLQPGYGMISYPRAGGSSQYLYPGLIPCSSASSRSGRRSGNLQEGLSTSQGSSSTTSSFPNDQHSGKRRRIPRHRSDESVVESESGSASNSHRQKRHSSDSLYSEQDRSNKRPKFQERFSTGEMTDYDKKLQSFQVWDPLVSVTDTKFKEVFKTKEEAPESKTQVKQTTNNSTEPPAETSEKDRESTPKEKDSVVLKASYGDMTVVTEDNNGNGVSVVITIQGYVFQGVASSWEEAVEKASRKALLLAPFLLLEHSSLPSETPES